MSNFPEYHKIQTLWARDPTDNYRTLQHGVWARPEFEYLQEAIWDFTEKVDGTNIRIGWDGQHVRVGGKTDAAQIPGFLLAELNQLFTLAKLGEKLPVERGGVEGYVLYGEGYGARIQPGGGKYLADRVSFVLFDVWSGGLWLSRENVADIGAKLGVQVVPFLGEGTLWNAISRVREGFSSNWGDFPAEGIVCRPKVELLDRRGQRVIGKIKTKDFQKEEE